MRAPQAAALILTLAACKPDADTPRVVVLVMDGVRVEESFSDGTTAADGTPTEDMLPRIRAELYPQGALVTGGLTTAATLTSQGHAALLTGRGLPYTNHFTDHEDTYRPELPTLFELLRRDGDQPERSAVFLANAWHLAPLSHSLYPGLGASAGARYELLARGSKLRSDQDTLDAVRSSLSRGAQLVVANLHDADRYAHAGSLDAYLGAAEGLDDSIMELWSWIQDDRVLSEATTLILVADHGRHRHGHSTDWIDHNDACMGCREIPMLLVGSNVPAGVSVDTTATLQDLSATVASLLGVSHPYTDGVPLSEAVLTDAPVRSGPLSLAAAGAQLAEQRLTEGATRSQIVLDGAPVSGGMFAEAPVMAADFERSVLCWRELDAPSADADVLPWRPACQTRTDGGSWEAIPEPFDEVSYVWEPALSVSADGAIWMASIDHPTEVDAIPADGGVWLQSWTSGGGWSARRDGPPDLFYPTHISLQPIGADWLVSFAAADSAGASRHGRNIRLYRVSVSEAGQDWREVVRTQTLTSGSGLDTGLARHERPALRVDGAQISIAFTGYDEDGAVELGLLQSSDGGATWSSEIVSTGPVFGHIRPVWGRDGRLYWAEHADSARACRRGTGGGVECKSTGTPYIEGLTVGDGAWASTHSGDQQWTLQAIDWD